MNRHKLQILVLAVAAGGMTAATQAAPVLYNFQTGSFSSFTGILAPTGPISGSFTLDGSSITQIDLTIGTYTYSLEEVGYDNSLVGIGGTLNGILGVASGTNDFKLFTGYPASAPFDDAQAYFFFEYAVPGSVDIYSSHATIVASTPTVPLPATGWLLGSAVFSLFTARRKLFA